MKIAVCSDLHLEFGDLVLKNEQGADVLILSGDIIVAKHLNKKDPNDILDGIGLSERFHRFFQNVCEEFFHVIYIMGNHEHYGGDFAFTEVKLRENLAYLRNLFILEKETIDFGDVTFVAGTLWTDMNKGDTITLFDIGRCMNDFRIVKNSKRRTYYKVPVYEYDKDNNLARDAHGKAHQIGMKIKEKSSTFSPEDAMEDHHKMFDYIRSEVKGKHNKKFVIVGHHAPSRKSTHPSYQSEVIMNGGYSSRLDEFILDNPQIKLWIHGHTHEDFDYMIGDCRIVCNPRGYHGHERRADRFQLTYVEV